MDKSQQNEEKEKVMAAFKEIEDRVIAKIKAEMEKLRNDKALGKLMEEEMRKTMGGGEIDST